MVQQFLFLLIHSQNIQAQVKQTHIPLFKTINLSKLNNGNLSTSKQIKEL